MDYKLAMELRNAGFPFDFGDIISVDVLPSILNFERYPTLGKLIDECGGRFNHLRRISTNMQILWEAEGIIEKDIRQINTEQVPIVAVARLWLALNKK